jgi:DNA-binding transcriptional LysR family regulator
VRRERLQFMLQPHVIPNTKNRSAYEEQLMRLSLRQLDAFRHFAANLSVTETARLTHVSQSAVSHSLHELERTLGISLFFRIGNCLRLTREGAALLPAMERVFAQLSQFDAQVESMRSVGAGHLTVATMPPIGTWLINGATARFLETRPKLRFSLRNTAAAEVLEQVRNETADIGFTITGGDDTGVLLEPLLRAEIVCVLPVGHRLCAKRQVTIADLQGERIIAPSADTAVGAAIRSTLPPGRRRQIDGLEINQSAAAVDLVARGTGIALVHPFGMPHGAEGVQLRRFRPVIELRVMIALPRNRPASPLIASYLQEIRRVAREAVGSARGAALFMTAE